MRKNFLNNNLPTLKLSSNPQKGHQYDLKTQMNPQGIIFTVQAQSHLFKKSQKMNLTIYQKKPQKNIKGVVIIFHGLNSYQQHGAHIADYYKQQGFVCIGFDHRNFGNSPHKQPQLRGQFFSDDPKKHHLEDSEIFVGLVRKRYPDLPFFLMGLSMGGMTAYYLTINKQSSVRKPIGNSICKGVVLMAPALKGVGLLQYIINFAQATHKNIVNNDPQVINDIQKQVAQGLVLRRPTFSAIKMLNQVFLEAQNFYKDYDFPFFVAQGNQDKLVSYSSILDLYKYSISKQKFGMFFDDMYHDVWHSSQHISQIQQKSANWMKYILDNKNPRPEQVLPGAAFPQTMALLSVGNPNNLKIAKLNIVKPTKLKMVKSTKLANSKGNKKKLIVKVGKKVIKGKKNSAKSKK